MKNKIVYREISNLLNAIENCKKVNNEVWKIKHNETIEKIIDRFFHYGSDILLDYTNSTSEKLIFYWSHHCMDENGYYNGYLDLKITITSSLQFGYNIKIVNSPYNQYQYRKYFKYQDDWFYDMFNIFLTNEFEYEFKNDEIRIMERK